MGGDAPGACTQASLAGGKTISAVVGDKIILAEVPFLASSVLARVANFLAISIQSAASLF